VVDTQSGTQALGVGGSATAVVDTQSGTQALGVGGSATAVVDTQSGTQALRVGWIRNSGSLQCSSEMDPQQR